MSVPLWMQVPLALRVVNWVRVHVLRRTTVYGIIRYAKPGTKFWPKFPEVPR